MKWEYKTASGTRITDASLNTYGAEGWELTAMIHDGQQAILIFKRPKAGEAKS